MINKFQQVVGRRFSIVLLGLPGRGTIEEHLPETKEFRVMIDGMKNTCEIPEDLVMKGVHPS